jgi:tetraacyldisaccharide 4'-kinase
MVLTRGYGGRVSEPSLVDRAVHRIGDVGDEALLLATELPVIVARNRRKGAQLADAHAADVVVMDDGHQNFHLVKDLSLVLVDAATGFGNGGIVPAGPLREFVRHGLARADAVILLGDGTPPLEGYGGPVLRAQIVPVDAASYARRRLVAFAGIGQPHRFFATLRKLDAELIDTIAFGDHHVFSAAEIARLKARAAGADALLVTTEKDYVRLTAAEREGISVLPVQAQFDRPELLQELLDRALRRAIA